MAKQLYGETSGEEVFPNIEEDSMPTSILEQIVTGYKHSQTSGNPHKTKFSELDENINPVVNWDIDESTLTLTKYDGTKVNYTPTTSGFSFLTLTGDSGTLTAEQLLVLIQSKDAYIMRSNKKYYLMENEQSNDYLTYINIDETTNSIKSINVVISTLDWSYTSYVNQTKTDNELKTDSKTIVGAINENKGNIATNTSDISTNTSDISTNKNNIATNTSDISSLKSDKQNKTDDTLETESKTIVGAINELSNKKLYHHRIALDNTLVFEIINNISTSFTYDSLITYLTENHPNEEFKCGGYHVIDNTVYMGCYVILQIRVLQTPVFRVVCVYVNDDNLRIYNHDENETVNDTVTQLL